MPKTMAEAIELTIRTDLAQLEQVQAALEAFCEHHALPPRTRYAVSLVFEELLTNIIEHGYQGRADGEIHVVLHRGGAELIGGIEDSGPPFDPTAVRQPDLAVELEDRQLGGLGVHLVRSMVSTLDYARQEERNVLTFRLAVGE